MKVLVTGGTGVISSGLVKESVNRGYETYALTRGNNKSRNIEGAEYLFADLHNSEEVLGVINNLCFDVVVECLAYNVEQLKESLNYFADKCNQYIFVSSTSVFGYKQLFVTEKTDKDGLEWDYSRAKIECENYLMEFFKNRKNNFTIIRPAVTYGNYRIPFPIATRKPVWSFFERIQSKKPVLSCNNVKFSVTHVDDFSSWVVSLFNNEKSYNEDFNISSENNGIYWDDVVSISDKEFGILTTVVHAPISAYELLWPEMVDELKFNKSNSKLVSDEKIRKTIKDFKITKQLDTGLCELIYSSKKEFDTNNFKIDYEWNERCDIVIRYCYLNNLLTKNEMDQLDIYYSGMNSDIIMILDKKMKVIKRKNSNEKIKNFVKKNIRTVKNLIK